MVEANRAREALAEVERRRGEATRLVLRRTLPPWYVTAVLAVLVILAVQVDLRDRIPDWDGWLARWGVPAVGVLIMLALGWIATRRAGLAPRAGGATGSRGAVLAVVVAYLVVVIGVGMPLRLYRVPWDQTISTVCGAVVLLVGWSVFRAVTARRRV